MCHGSLHHSLDLLTFVTEISLLTSLVVPARTDSGALHVTHTGFLSSACRNKDHTFKFEQASVVYECVYWEKLFGLFIFYSDAEIK